MRGQLPPTPAHTLRTRSSVSVRARRFLADAGLALSTAAVLPEFAARYRADYERFLARPPGPGAPLQLLRGRSFGLPHLFNQS